MGTIIDGIWSDDFAFKTAAIGGWDIYNAPTNKTYYEPANITVTDDNNKLYHGPFRMLKYVNNEMRRWFLCTDIENSTDIYDIFLSYQAAFCNSTSNDDIQMYTNDTIINSISAVQSGTTINDNTFSTNVQNTGCSTWYIITASELLLFSVSSGIRFDLVLRIRTNDNVYAVISNIEIECRLPPTTSPTSPNEPTHSPSKNPSNYPTQTPSIPPTVLNVTVFETTDNLDDNHQNNANVTSSFMANQSIFIAFIVVILLLVVIICCFIIICAYFYGKYSTQREMTKKQGLAFPQVVSEFAIKSVSIPKNNKDEITLDEDIVTKTNQTIGVVGDDDMDCVKSINATKILMEYMDEGEPKGQFTIHAYKD